MRVKAKLAKSPINAARASLPYIFTMSYNCHKLNKNQGVSFDRVVEVCCLQPGQHRVSGGRLYVRLMTLSNALSKLIQHFFNINSMIQFFSKRRVGLTHDGRAASQGQGSVNFYKY